jgi:HD-like signal output (HDOD) protein
MTAKMLQIVNSAVMGLAHKVSSPFEAVEYLGLGTVRSLVLSAHIFSCFKQVNLKRFSVNQLWSHSLRTALVARRIMHLEQADPIDGEDAYAAGMLHDVGKLMLAESRPDLFQQALGLAAERPTPLPDAEREILGATDSGVAAYLLGLWGLPAAIVEAVAFHHTPRASEVQVFGPLTAVHVAAVLEQELADPDATRQRDALDTEYLVQVGVQARLKDWREAARDLLEAQKSE